MCVHTSSQGWGWLPTQRPERVPAKGDAPWSVVAGSKGRVCLCAHVPDKHAGMLIHN